MAGPITVVIDANVFLHYQDVDQIPWKSVAGGEVELFVPFAVVRELDREKDNPKRDRLRRRARAALGRLEMAVGAGADGIRIVVEAREPSPAFFEENELQPEWPDDRIVASCIALRAAGSNVVLCSGDVGPRLKARRVEIPVLDISPYRLEDEPDAREVELRRYRAQEALGPSLSVAFEDGSTHGEFASRDDPAVDVEEVMDAVRVLHPVDDRGVIEGLRTSEFDSKLLAATLARKTRERDAKNEATRQFHEQYRRYLESLRVWREARRRTHVISLVVINEGQQTAEDIHVFVSAPPDIALGFPRELPAGPDVYEPPLQGQLPEQIRAQLITEDEIRHAAGAGANANIIRTGVARPSGRVIELHRVKPGVSEWLPHLCVGFPHGVDQAELNVVIVAGQPAGRWEQSIQLKCSTEA